MSQIYYSVIVTNQGRPCRLHDYPASVEGVPPAGPHEALSLGHVLRSAEQSQTTAESARMDRGGRAQMVIDTSTGCRDDIEHETRSAEFQRLVVELPGRGSFIAHFRGGGEGTAGKFGVWLPCQSSMSRFYQAFHD